MYSTAELFVNFVNKRKVTLKVKDIDDVQYIVQQGNILSTNGILAFHAFALLGQIIYCHLSPVPWRQVGAQGLKLDTSDVLKDTCMIGKTKNIVHAVHVYGQLVQTLRGTVSITRQVTCTWIFCHYITRTSNEKCITYS